MTGLGSSCGACKFLRRKCATDCVFAPYFSYDQASTHFAAVHKIYGASNVSRLLSHLPIQNRSDAAITISYEALARMQDPIYGCVAHIYALQQQVASLQEEIDTLGSLMTNSTISVVNCDSVQAPKTIRSATVYQSFDSQMDMELPSAHVEEPSFGDSYYNNPLEQFLSGIDQEVFMNHPWFKHNADIKN
ncbi:LOB domain-containing protein 33 [Cajanus cajan]|uniref:LOB domain-containing protein 33 n=1 Tax=Cajanus cajan TaxID=3821 RepID=UPI0010FAE0B4|nr:LOB domain-containing protein 33 [Cajanus cajan]